ncbi:MAG: FecR domain-containing protein [Deltaproteobacteria bacterium]|nr:FecR domain-containing protein [Deltaproteobacteria bacterium]
MTTLSCLWTGPLLERRAAGLDDGDRLRLEEHLAGCERCAAEARALGRIAELTDGAHSPLSSRARRRAIEGALAGAGARAATPLQAGGTRSVRTQVLAAVAIVALAMVLGGLVRSQRATSAQLGDPLGVTLAATADGGDQLLDGQLEADGVTVSPGHGWAPGALLSSATGARLWLGHGLVQLGPDTGARWNGTISALALLRGTVEVAVDGTVGRRFAVTTPGFEVEVVGTHFAVNPTGVEVYRGRVRVFELPSGRAVTELAAGQRWWVAERSRETAAAGDENGPDADGLDSATPRRSPTELLARARRQLADGRVATARRTVATVLTRPQPAAVEAEARSLLAECALLGGDDAEAARRYAEVARKFAQLPAGETALFAAGRAQQEAGEPTAARASLRQYLHRYPNGRFVAEARRRLTTLSREGQTP